MSEPQDPVGPPPWPNQQPIPDGVQDVSQDQDLFADDATDGGPPAGDAPAGEG
jgi:hypothetical protein